MKSLQTALGLMLAAALAATTATAQQYTISTVAGTGQSQGWYGDGYPATSAELDVPTRVAVDSKGNFYIVDYRTFIIREVTSAGVISTIAGDGTPGYSGDNGVATSASIFDVHGIAVDSTGNVYLADTGNSRIREVAVGNAAVVNTTGSAPAGDTVLTVASATGIQVGMSVQGAGIDGGTVVTAVNGNAVNLSRATLAALASGTPVKFALTNIVTFAGNGTAGYSGDGGAATSASLSRPAGVAVDSSGNVYIADYGNSTVRKVSTSGTITTIAGTGTLGYSGDGGPANKAMLAAPYAIALDPAGNIYVSDTTNANIRKITTDGNIHTVASNIDAESLAIDAAGNIYYPDYLAQTVQKLLPTGAQVAIAGNGTAGFSGDGGLATSAQLNLPYGVALDSSGNIYVADSNNQVIRLLTPVSSSIGIVNAASGIGGAVSPGEIVVLYGTGIGPSTLAVNQPVKGLYGTQAGGTTVSFDGNPAPILYASATQVAAIVPYEEPVGATATVTVTYQGQTLNATVPVASTVPGIFTANSTGTGQAAAVNQDGTLNSAANPAPVGSYISIYATGEGLTNPGGVDGQIASSTPGANLPQPVQQIKATVSGQSAVVSYAGAAPGEVEGLMQLNLQIPVLPIQSGAPPVSVPVVLLVAGLPSQTAVTIFVSAQ